MVAPGSDDSLVVRIPHEVGERVAAAARQQNRSPDDVVVEACRRLLAAWQTANLDDEYERGYVQAPEDTSDTSALLPHLPLPSEDWT
jgi:hypothetical protein